MPPWISRDTAGARITERHAATTSGCGMPIPMPMRTVPDRPCRMSRTAASASFRPRSMPRTCCRNSSPACVSDTPRAPRSISCEPRPRSSRAIALDNVGWLVPSFCDAATSEPASATATKLRMSSTRSIHSILA